MSDKCAKCPECGAGEIDLSGNPDHRTAHHRFECGVWYCDDEPEKGFRDSPIPQWCLSRQLATAESALEKIDNQLDPHRTVTDSMRLVAILAILIDFKSNSEGG